MRSHPLIWSLVGWSDLWLFSLSLFIRSVPQSHTQKTLSLWVQGPSVFFILWSKIPTGFCWRRSNSPGVLDSSEVYSAALRLNESPAPASPALLVLLNTVAHSKGLQCLRWWTHSIRYSNSQRINENYCNNEKLQNYIIVRSEVQSHSIVCLHNETISSTLFIQKQHT